MYTSKTLLASAALLVFSALPGAFSAPTADPNNHRGHSNNKKYNSFNRYNNGGDTSRPYNPGYYPGVIQGSPYLAAINYDCPPQYYSYDNCGCCPYNNNGPNYTCVPCTCVSPCAGNGCGYRYPTCCSAITDRGCPGCYGPKEEVVTVTEVVDDCEKPYERCDRYNDCNDYYGGRVYRVVGDCGCD